MSEVYLLHHTLPTVLTVATASRDSISMRYVDLTTAEQPGGWASSRVAGTTSLVNIVGADIKLK